MTIGQKREVIDNYCSGRMCGNCVLNDSWCVDYSKIETCSEEELDRALKLIATDATFELEEESKPNNVDHPSHYNQGGIECIDAMVSAFGKDAVAGFCVVNAFKYVWRAAEKNGTEDIDKAIWYLNKFKELNGNVED